MISTAFLSVFLDEVIRLLELFELSEECDRLVQHVIFDVVCGGFFELSLKGQNFRGKPNFIQVSHLVHLLGCLTEVDQRQLLDMTECLPCNDKLLCKKSVNAQSFPVLNGNADACEFVCHDEVPFFKETVKSATLRHVDCIHGGVT